MRIVRYYPRAAVGDGGMTSAVKHWSESFARAGVEAVIAYDRGKSPDDNGNVNWVQVEHTGPSGLRMPRGLSKVLKGTDLLVLHSGWTLHNLKAASEARKLGVPYLLEPRGAYDPHIVGRKRALKSAWWRAQERKLVSEAAAIHVFFDEERSHLDALGYAGPVVVASNGVEEQSFRWTGGGGYVLWLGRFDPEHKGLDLLFEGLGEIPESERPVVRIQGPDWRGRKARVERLVERLGLSAWARIGNAVYGTEKKQLLAQADAFVYPSRWDACPNSVLESVAMGIPTITTPYPLGSYLGGRGGSVLAPGTAAGIGSALMTATSADAAEIGRTGSEIAARDLTWDAVGLVWLDQAKALI
jgi:glycosyltransferase involved in cell wall biosynthesis